MSKKRLTDTFKWEHAWFRKLKPKMKCAWFYLLDKCDHAGVWSVDFETIEFHIGEPISKEDLELFGNRLKWISEDKIWIPSYLTFQYGTLKEDCKPHRAAADRLRSLSLWEEYLKFSFKGSMNPSVTVHNKDKDKDKDIDKNKEKDQEPDSREPLSARTNWLEEANLVFQTAKLFGFTLNEKVRTVLGTERTALVRAAGGLLDLGQSPPNDFTIKSLAGKLRAAYEVRSHQEGA